MADSGSRVTHEPAKAPARGQPGPLDNAAPEELEAEPAASKLAGMPPGTGRTRRLRRLQRSLGNQHVSKVIAPASARINRVQRQGAPAPAAAPSSTAQLVDDPVVVRKFL